MNKEADLDALKEIRDTDEELIKRYIVSYNYYDDWKNEYRHLEEQDLIAMGEMAGLFEGWGKSNYFSSELVPNKKPIMDKNYTDNITQVLKEKLENWSSELGLHDMDRIVHKPKPIVNSKLLIQNL